MIRGIAIMGGLLSRGNVSPSAEFNSTWIQMRLVSSSIRVGAEVDSGKFFNLLIPRLTEAKS